LGIIDCTTGLPGKNQVVKKTVAILSDFCLDEESSLLKFEDLLVQLEVSEKIPGLLIVCGQFIRNKSIRNQEDQKRIMDKFKDFRKILTRYQPILEQMHMVLVPGKPIKATIDQF
jgi:hypothetical protein